jgi:catechol 2,3-dioxygenase-like lactoylglutathione lyase family enzyme
MKFRMSPNIAIRPKGRFARAVHFYSNVLGFENRSSNPQLADLNASPINLFIDEDDEFPGPILELYVDDLEKAREILESNGCKFLRWRGKGQDCYIQDPFGVIFNLWEE